MSKMKKSQLKKVLRPVVRELMEEQIEYIIHEDDYIKKTIMEMVFKGDIVSNLITEVAKGVASAQGMLTEAQRSPQRQPRRKPAPTRSRPEATSQVSAQEQERLRQIEAEKKKELNKFKNEAKAKRNRMAEGIMSKIPNGDKIFEGTQPVPSAASGEAAKRPKGDGLAGVAPDDPGLNISGIVNMVGDKWKKHTGEDNVETQ